MRTQSHYGEVQDAGSSGMRLEDGPLRGVPSDILKPGPTIRRKAKAEKNRARRSGFSAKDAGDAIAKAAFR